VPSLFHNAITNACEKAIVAFLHSETLTFVTNDAIFPGVESADAEGLPRVLVQCVEADAEGSPYEGNWYVMAQISLRSTLDQQNDTDPAPQDVHFENAGELFAKFMTSTNDTDLTVAAIPFTSWSVQPVKQGWFVEDRSVVSFLRLRIHCCGS